MNALLAILNIFIDPASSVRYQNEMGKKAWILPFLIGSLVLVVTGFVQLPIMAEAIRNNPGPNMSAQEAEAAAEMMAKFGKFTLVFGPVTLAIMMLVSAGLTFGFAKIFDLRVAFPAVFSLISHSSLVSMLAAVAQTVVLTLKGSINSVSELRPAFGLDLLLAEDANRFLAAFLNYFSFFTLWYMVVLVLGFAALAQTDKGKAFLVTSPVWLLGLVFALFGAVFSR